jgi:hypothetical protein
MVQANYRESLLHGGTRETTSRANGEDMSASGIRPCAQILDVEGK